MDRRASHARSGFNQFISFGRSGLRYGNIPAVLSSSIDHVRSICCAGYRLNFAVLDLEPVQELRPWPWL